MAPELVVLGEIGQQQAVPEDIDVLLRSGIFPSHAVGLAEDQPALLVEGLGDGLGGGGLFEIGLKRVDRGQGFFHSKKKGLGCLLGRQRGADQGDEKDERENAVHVRRL